MIRLNLRDGDDWRPGGERGSRFVRDLQQIGFERCAGVWTILNPDSASLDGYLADRYDGSTGVCR